MRFVKKFSWALLLFISKECLPQDRTNESAKGILTHAILELGTGWDTIHALKLEGYGTSFVVDQSERFEGPYIPSHVNRRMIVLPAQQIMQVEEQQNDFVFGGNTTYLLNASGIAVKDQEGLRAGNEYESLQDRLFLSPDILFRKALASGSLRRQKDTLLQKTAQYTLSFVYDNFPVRIFISKESFMITAAEITRPLKADYARLWGDSEKMVYYSFWDLLDKDVHYPLQTDIYINGYYKETFLINHWELNPPVSVDSLTIPNDVISDFSARDKSTLNRYVGTMNNKAIEIAKDIWLLPGPCNTTVVKQEDGIIVIESSYSSEYGDAILRKVKDLYPGSNIKAFVATSDAWFHLGGIRPFAARNIKFYFPFRNEPLIRKILTANYKTFPDSLSAKGYTQLNLIGVKDVINVGNGSNQIQLFPYKTETGDRMMMVYFPKQKILYCSDLFQPKGPDGKYWQPHYAWEVYHAIKDYHIDAARFYAMHMARLQDISILERDFQ
jgi:glyoxylase-like metal-dependent hydrolase (beta-lactamase superfamily II)